jgi:hypothetical protein
MSQVDWIGEPPPKKFKDLPNLRPGIAEEKAMLCKRIGDVCMRVPPDFQSMSVNKVRQWKQDREGALKVAGNKRASIHELTAALNSMSRWK